MSRLLPIVEGYGDLAAVPLLIRRVLHELHGRCDVDVLPPQRRGEWPRVKQDFARFFLSARLENAPILWVLDFDCADCIDVDAERNWALAEAAKPIVSKIRKRGSRAFLDAPMRLQTPMEHNKETTHA